MKNGFINPVLWLDISKEVFQIFVYPEWLRLNERVLKYPGLQKHQGGCIHIVLNPQTQNHNSTKLVKRISPHNEGFLSL